MGLSNFPNGVSSFGIPVLGGMQLPTTTGKYIFVSSVTGANGNDGLDSDHPKGTVNGAVAACTANKGDIIVVMSNHAEDLDAATDFVVDTSGVRVIGLGEGDDRPTFTYTGVDGSIEMDSANCGLYNLLLLTSITAVVMGININADNITVDTCETNWDASGDDFITMIDVDAVDGFTLRNSKLIAEDGAGCEEAIRLDDCNNVSIVDNHIYGFFTDSAIKGEGAGGTNLLIAKNTIYNSDTTAGFVVDLDVAFTGLMTKNSCGTLYATDPETTVDPGSLLCIENYVCNAVDESGAIVPTVIST